MRNLITTIVLFIVLLAGTVAFAEVRIMDTLNVVTPYKAVETEIKPKEFVSSLCIEGYVFVRVFGAVTTNAGTGTGVSIVQVYEERDGKAVPMRCKPAATAE